MSAFSVAHQACTYIGRVCLHCSAWIVSLFPPPPCLQAEPHCVVCATYQEGLRLNFWVLSQEFPPLPFMQGERHCVVYATGLNTFFGRAAALLGSAQSVANLQ
jgi:hypothetical protein